MNLLTFASPIDLILEIPQQDYDQAWERQVYSNPTARYQAYINELCLSAILPWLQQDLASQAKVSYNTTALPSFWELVNGTAINVDSRKIILVPQETIDLSELRVPQEWVDIPSWAGDYYLGVQIVPEDRCIRVWGYCTHLQLKTQGVYSPYTRTYSLDAGDISDINLLAVSYDATSEAKRAPVPTLPSLTTTVAQNLIARLANPDIVSPRLEIPFQTWGALIENGGWRSRLYQHRIGQPEQSVIQWLQNGITNAAQQLGWDSLSLQLQGAARSIEEVAVSNILVRQLTIAGQTYELRIVPQINEEYTTWRFELQNAAVGGFIPGGFKLRLLTEDLQSFPDNEDTATTATEQLFVEVALEPGEGIVWEIEPVPENYDQEILRF
jgi:Protein of unknown function (DUF1822)